MDEFQKELAELKQFIVELKADRAATKEKEKRESWTKYVSMSVVIIAVIASIAAQKAGKFSSTVQMSQVQASDEWNFFQAQSIKEHLFEINRNQLVKAGPDADAAQKEFDAKIKAYEKKKEESQAKAKKLEAKRDEASHLGSRMGPAVSCFTISIAIASICLVTKKKPLWIISMGLAGVGLLFWGGVIEKILTKGS